MHCSIILQARILEGVAFPSSRGSSQPRDQTRISHTAGRFFTNWVTREVQEYWSGLSFPPLGHLPNPGIEPRSPALQTDSLPAEPPGKPIFPYYFFSICRFCSEVSFIPSACNLCLSLLPPPFLVWPG